MLLYITPFTDVCRQLLRLLLSQRSPQTLFCLLPPDMFFLLVSTFVKSVGNTEVYLGEIRVNLTIYLLSFVSIKKL